MNASIRVLVADDHPLMREGIAAVIARCDDLQVVGEAGSGHAAIEEFRRGRPDVIVMDLQMPDLDGLSAMAKIREESPGQRFIVLTTYPDPALQRRAHQAGACAYLLKTAIRSDLTKVIRDVFAAASTSMAHATATMHSSALSEREIDILQRIADGRSNVEIASSLSISEETVKTHIVNFRAKLQATDRAHAVRLAVERGILQLTCH